MTKRFSAEEIANLRTKYAKDPSVINKLKESINLIFEHDINVQKTGKASWNHYFYCKKHTTRLEWDINSPKEYKCPVDGEVFTGEPYEGAWWCKLNDHNIDFIKVAPFIWLVTKERKYLDKAIELIMEYAKNFENYEATGGIPDNENNLGRFGGQTLYDSIYLTPLVSGYDIMKDELSGEQIDVIENKLIIPLCEHLQKQHVQHLHNHEIKACAGIGIAGIVLENEGLIDYALNHKYALLDNLNRGFSDDGLWFENSTFYHLYSVTGLLAFESFAHKTKWSLQNQPKFYEAIVSPVNYLLPNGNLIMVNDMTPGQDKLVQAGAYEFCNYLFPNDEKIIYILNLMYKNVDRDSTEAFIYGEETVPKTTTNLLLNLKSANYAANGFRFYRFTTRNNDQKAVVFNYSKYSGEHNHHDPLSLIIFGYDEQIMVDLGTTGYGSPMHKGYYKTTAMHNTVSVDGKNQPARDSKLLEDKVISDNEIQTVVSVNFNKSKPVIDSDFNIEWDEETYKDIEITRYFNWTPAFYTEVTHVINPHKRNVQWNAVLDGKMKDKFGESIDGFKEDTPYQYLSDVQVNNNNSFKLAIQGKNSDLQILAKNKNETKNFVSDAPANPADRKVKHVMRVSSDNDIWFATVFEHRLQDHHESKDFEFNINDNTIDISIQGAKKHNISFKKY